MRRDNKLILYLKLYNKLILYLKLSLFSAAFPIAVFKDQYINPRLSVSSADNLCK